MLAYMLSFYTIVALIHLKGPTSCFTRLSTIPWSSAVNTTLWCWLQAVAHSALRSSYSFFFNFHSSICSLYSSLLTLRPSTFFSGCAGDSRPKVFVDHLGTRAPLNTLNVSLSKKLLMMCIMSRQTSQIRLNMNRKARTHVSFTPVDFRG